MVRRRAAEPADLQRDADDHKTNRAGKRHWYISDHGGLISESELLRCQGFEPSRVTVPAHTNREKVCEMAGNAMTVTVMRCLLRNGLRALGRM